MSEKVREKAVKKNTDYISNYQLTYQILSNNRIAYDKMMWQVPALTITAQAFLYSIGFQKMQEIPILIITTILNVLIGLLAIQLMSKHRYHEMEASKQLHDIELQNNLIQIHKKKAIAKSNVINYSSFDLWKGLLLVMTFFPLLALVFKFLW